MERVGTKEKEGSEAWELTRKYEADLKALQAQRLLLEKKVKLLEADNSAEYNKAALLWGKAFMQKKLLEDEDEDEQDQ